VGRAIFKRRSFMTELNKKRDGFSSKWGFILACIGSAVGMGNLWRFPVMVSAWGGMTFLIPYFIFVILIGSTGVIEEFALGRLAQSGPVGAFGYATGKRGNRKTGEMIGLIPVLGSLALAIGYTVVMGWIFKYTWLAINGTLTSFGNNMDIIGGTFGATASAFGNNMWLVIAGLVSFIIMSLGVADGIEKANKIMMPILFFLMVGLAIYIGFQPGASDGYKYIFTVNSEMLADPKLWIFAFGQAFFSLSIAGNGSVIYGSYLPKSEDLPNSARNVAFFDTIAALIAAFVIIPAMAVAGSELSAGGPGLMFIYLVNVINQMAAGRIIIVVFYVAVLFAGTSSIINLYEAPVAYLQEQFNIKRLPASAIINIGGLIVAIFIQGIIEGWMDAVSIYIAPLGALLAGIMFFWILDKDEALSEVNLGRTKPIGSWFYPLGKYLYVLLAAIALIAGAVLGGIG